MKPQLCLGTAQFGMAYGVTNMAGQVSETLVAQVLAEAEGSGIRWLDTAQAYGDAEVVIGRNLPLGHHFELINKLPAQRKQSFTAEDIAIWEQDFRASCVRLGLKRIDALLLHAPRDLNKPGGEWLRDWLFGLRQRGLVRRLGISIYTAEDLEGVDPEILDLVQLPLSLYDQRLLKNGTVRRLRVNGSAIHARSLYLQGLLLSPASHWPGWVAPEVRSHQQALEALAQQRGCQLIDLALGFAQEQTDLEAAVLGVCNLLELQQLLRAWDSVQPFDEGEWQDWALDDAKILDPRNWPEN